MKILIESLTFKTILGILEHERLEAQNVILDCVIDYLYSNEHFINYAEVASILQTTMQEKQFFLIEEALEVLGTTLKNHFPSIQELSLTIRKPNILPNCIVGVQKKFFF